MPRRPGRAGGRPVRDLDDALDGSDEPQPFLDGPALRAEQAYAREIGSYQYGAPAIERIGTPPDTIYDDYQEDIQ